MTASLHPIFHDGNFSAAAACELLIGPDRQPANRPVVMAGTAACVEYGF
jgi:hypothetical protein